MIHKLGAELGAPFEIKLLGSLTTYLGIDITRDGKAHTLTLSQEKYICPHPHQIPREGGTSQGHSS